MFGNMMYLRPGNLKKDFWLERKIKGSTNSRGRIVYEYDKDNPEIVQGILASATPEQKFRWNQLQHPISHVIVQEGPPKAKPQDRFILEDRVFYIKGVDDGSSLGIFTHYYAEERSDINE